MKLNLVIDLTDISNINVDLLGELLRNEFFQQYKDGKWVGTGCYSVFDTNPGVTQLGNETFDGTSYNVFEKDFQGRKVIMRYYWDGDGYLEFQLPCGNTIYNTDCKKDYNWKMLPHRKES